VDDAQVGQWIRTRRKQLDLTRAQLAAIIGYSVETLKKIEAGERRPSRELAAALAQVLAVAPDERDAFVKQARATALPGSVPPRAHQAGNLPHPLTPLIGREAEVAAVAALLCEAGTRLVTLLGSPGVGKTRLAIQTGHALATKFADGVWVVDLAALVDADLLCTVVAQTLALPLSSAHHPRASVAMALQPRDLLLILDNFEQIPAAADDVAALLRHSARLKVLVTSRVPLQLSGEQEVVVAPLDVHGDEDALLAEANWPPAIRLFVARVRAFDRRFTPDGATLATIEQICARLAGIPLAIELAAARLRDRTAGELLANLQDSDHTLDLLTQGARDLPSRQRTLRAAIDWSYRLLPLEEQRLFCSLSVFAGPFAATRAAVVAAPSADPPDASTETALATLVNHSLLAVETNLGGVSTYRLIDTIRAFAAEALQASGAAPAIWLRHADFCIDLAQQNHTVYAIERNEDLWRQRLSADQENLRGLLHWLLDHADALEAAERALELSGLLGHFWYLNGGWHEGIGWLTAALDRSGAAAPCLRVRALTVRGMLHTLRAEYALAQNDFAAATVLIQEADLPFDRAWLLYQRGYAWLLAGELAQSQRALAEATTLLRTLERPWHLALVTEMLGSVLVEQGELAAAAPLLVEVLAFHAANDDEPSQASALNMLGEVYLLRGDLDDADAAFASAYARFTRAGHQHGQAWAARNRGYLHLWRGDFAAAAVALQESLQMYRTLGGEDGMLAALEGAAGLLVARGQMTSAAQLLGAVDAWRAQIGCRVTPFGQRVRDRLMAPAAALLEAAEWRASLEAGSRLARAEVLALALAAQSSMIDSEKS